MIEEKEASEHCAPSSSTTSVCPANAAVPVSIGAASVLAPMYIAEVAPAGIRGRLASLQQMAIVLGLFCAVLSNDILAWIFADLNIHWIKEGTEPLEAVLAQRLVKAAAQLEGEAVGDPLDWQTEIGPMVSKVLIGSSW